MAAPTRVWKVGHMTCARHHPLSSSWALYAHSPSDATTYRSCFAHVCDVATCEQWGQMVRHVPAASTLADPAKTMTIHGRPVTSFSLFRDGITPEWEHPRNRGGHTLTARFRRTPADCAALWVDLVAESARGAFDDGVLGVQLSARHTPSVVHLKLDVWCEDPTDAPAPLHGWARNVGLSLVRSERRG